MDQPIVGEEMTKAYDCIHLLPEQGLYARVNLCVCALSCGLGLKDPAPSGETQHDQIAEDMVGL